MNQEVRHKLTLLEENKQLKETLQKTEEEKKKLEQAQDKKVLIAEDTLRVLEETIGRFGMYISQKEEEEETSSEEQEMPELVSNLQNLLKKASAPTPEANYRQKVPSQPKRNPKLFIDLQIEDKEPDLRKTALERKKKSKFHKRAKDQIIWEEEETESNCGDAPRIPNGKSKAQAMFAKMLQENRGNQSRFNKKALSPKFEEDSTSDDSDYDSKSGEIAEKPLTSSYEENSS